MREIKFRVWDKDRKSMISNLSIPDISHGFFVEFGDRKFVDMIKDLIWMQYTGLKDKNGKEIYEGDIVEYHYDDKIDIRGSVQCRFEVVFDGGSFVQKHPAGDPDIWYDWKDIEVIGNIDENPELLK